MSTNAKTSLAAITLNASILLGASFADVNRIILAILSKAAPVRLLRSNQLIHKKKPPKFITSMFAQPWPQNQTQFCFLNRLEYFILFRIFLTDIDECTAYQNPCGSNAICKNAVPGYSCLCPPGYSANPSPQVACDQVHVTFFHYIWLSFHY